MRTFLLFVVIAVPVLLAIIWLVFLETSVQIAPGNLGLLLVRGRTTDRVLTPGRHFVSPFRRAMVATYPSRELAYLATRDWTAVEPTNDIQHRDPPLPVRLGDRTACRVSYTVRFRIDQPRLSVVHERFGPDGIWAVVRDESRRTLITQLGDAAVTSADLSTSKWAELEAKLGAAVQSALTEVGLDMTFFSLVDSGLGNADEVVQAAVRARLAVAKRQSERLTGDAAVVAGLADEVLLYRQFEVWRELVARWDGRTPLPTVVAGAMLGAPESADVQASGPGAGA